VSDELHGVVICRSAAEPLTRAATMRGYRCKICTKALQVSPNGVAQIARGGTPLCNRCGFEYAKAVEERGQLGGIVLSPDATDYLKKEGGFDPASLIRPPAQRPQQAATFECPLCGREHSAREGQTISCQCGIAFVVARQG
jgi:transcription elongation factor Elf1